MRHFHNTPSLRVSPAAPPVLHGRMLLDSLEDKFADYRRDAAAGYFKSDPGEVAKFQADIAAARAAAQKEGGA